jgi:hypothetical protein
MGLLHNQPVMGLLHNQMQPVMGLLHNQMQPVMGLLHNQMQPVMGLLHNQPVMELLHKPDATSNGIALQADANSELLLFTP